MGGLKGPEGKIIPPQHQRWLLKGEAEERMADSV